MYSTDRTRFLYDNVGFLGSTDRDDVSLEKSPGRDDNKNIDSQDGYGTSKYPRGVSDDCIYGNEHRWMDYGWADQGKAACKDCDATIWKEDLPHGEMIDGSF